MTSETVIAYKAEPTAQKFHRSRKFFRGLMGPIGSGKSVACTEELKRIAFSQKADAQGRRRTRFAVVRNTYPELKSTTIKTFQDWFPEEICPINWGAPITGRMIRELPDGTVIDMEVLFLALDKPKDVKKLLSLELTAVWLNEAREIPKTIVDAATGRVGRFPAKRDGGPTQACVIADTNPPDDDHWWYRYAENDPLIDEEPPTDWEFFQQPPALLYRNGRYEPNPMAENIDNLPSGYEYYLQQIGGKTKEWIKVYVYGQYGTVEEGKPVYSEYNDELHCPRAELKPHPKMPLLLGWDFGLTPSCIVCQVTPRGQFRILHEFIAERMGIKQFAKSVVKPGLKRLYPDHGIGLSVGDPSGRSSSDTDEKSCMRILREVGIPTVAAPSNAPVRRLGAVRDKLTTLIDGRPGLVVSRNCKILRKGFNGGYKYVRLQVAGSETRYRETPDKNRFSHPHDALQYACMMADRISQHSKTDDFSHESEDYAAASSAGY